MVRSALEAVGISSATQTSMFRILSGILHLGNIKFSELGGDEASAISNEKEAQIAAELLGAPELPQKLVKRTIKVRAGVG